MQALLNATTQLARAAGEAILAVYAHPTTLRTKDDHTPLTEADLAAHRVLAAGLSALTPHWPLLSEESAAAPWAERQQWTRYWLIDPLDGTKEFLKRNGEFTVNIALIDHGRAILGVVHVPVSGETYLAANGCGAWMLQGDGSSEARTALRVAPPPPAGQALRVVGSRSHDAERAQAIASAFAAVEYSAIGSSLKFCRVASGAAHLYPRFGLTSEWDTAAGQCVLEHAGGCVLALPEGQALAYNSKDSLLNPSFIAACDLALAQQALTLSRV